MTLPFASVGPMMHVVVPVRHPALVRDPAKHLAGLSQLLASLHAQTDTRFRCHLVVNPHQVLPPLPAFARRLDLDLPPNTAVERAATREAAYDAVRLDKGTRVRAAVTDLSPEDLVMVVDEDDLVSRRLVAFVQARRVRSRGPQAWVIDKGYAWQDGSASAQLVDQFHRLCGTCLIVPAGRYKLFRLGPDASDADQHEATVELGSHRLLVDSDLRAGRRFGRVPFRAAIYRTGHANSTQSLLGIQVAAPSQRTVLDRLRPSIRRLKRLLRSDAKTLLEGPLLRDDPPVPLLRLHTEFFGRHLDRSDTSRSGDLATYLDLPSK